MEQGPKNAQSSQPLLRCCRYYTDPASLSAIYYTKRRGVGVLPQCPQDRTNTTLSFWPNEKWINRHRFWYFPCTKYQIISAQAPEDHPSRQYYTFKNQLGFVSGVPKRGSSRESLNNFSTIAIKPALNLPCATFDYDVAALKNKNNVFSYKPLMTSLSCLGNAEFLAVKIKQIEWIK